MAPAGLLDRALQELIAGVGPPRGLGAKARVHSSFAGLRDTADIEVVGVDAPARIVERNISVKGRRVATGTYDLADLPAGGTRISFT